MKKNFTTNDELFEFVSNAISQWTYEESHKHEEIAKVLNVEQCSTTYYYYISKLNKILATKNKRLKSISRYGYKLIKPNDYQYVAVSKIESALNVIRLGKDLLRNSPYQEMDKESTKKCKAIFEEIDVVEHSISYCLCNIKFGEKNNPMVYLSSKNKKVK
jgi:hypothetical protein